MLFTLFSIFWLLVRFSLGFNWCDVGVKPLAIFVHWSTIFHSLYTYTILIHSLIELACRLTGSWLHRWILAILLMDLVLIFMEAGILSAHLFALSNDLLDDIICKPHAPLRCLTCLMRVWRNIDLLLILYLSTHLLISASIFRVGIIVIGVFRHDFSLLFLLLRLLKLAASSC